MPVDVTVCGSLKLDPYTPSVRIQLWDQDKNEVYLKLDTEVARQLKDQLKDFFGDKK